MFLAPRDPFARRFPLIRFRPGVVLTAALLLAVTLAPGKANAAADVHKLNLTLSGMPTSVNTGDFNDAIETYNNRFLATRGYEGLPKINFTWMFDGQFRYFVRENFSVNVGVGQLRAGQEKEFLPALSQAINVRAEVLTVPVHVGGAYYLQAFNQGDFRARMFLGAGMVQYTHSRATFEQVLTNPDTTLIDLGTSFRSVLTQDAPGYYLEGGVNMWFASRYAVLLSAMYRSGELRNVIEGERYIQGQPAPGFVPGPVLNSEGKPFKLDVGGVGFRLGVMIGL